MDYMNNSDMSGGKSRGLEELITSSDLGYFVPEYESVRMEYFESILRQHLVSRLTSLLTNSQFTVTKLPEQFNAVLKILADKYKRRQVMVRSNSYLEDGDHSFAGIYDSFLVDEVNEANLHEAFIQVYSSTFSEKAKKYREQHGLSEDKMSIIVQEFIEPDQSGVMYTSNPTYPDDLSIEFTNGRNTVVEGTGNSFIIDYDKATSKRTFESERKRKTNY